MIKSDYDICVNNMGWWTIDNALWWWKEILEGVLGEGELTAQKLENCLLTHYRKPNGQWVPKSEYVKALAEYILKQKQRVTDAVH